MPAEEDVAFHCREPSEQSMTLRHSQIFPQCYEQEVDRRIDLEAVRTPLKVEMTQRVCDFPQHPAQTRSRHGASYL